MLHKLNRISMPNEAPAPIQYQYEPEKNPRDFKVSTPSDMVAFDETF